MTCNITTTPLYVEPLPLYQRENPDDAISIHSVAPSYHSEAPTYTSHRQNPPAAEAATSPPRRVGLPAPQYAPGYLPRSQFASPIETSALSASNWSSTRNSHARRQYQAVAARRANKAANTTAILNSLSAVPPPVGAASSSSVYGSPSPSASQVQLGAGPNPTRSTSYPVDVTAAPASPLEDPYLVGEEAARKARAQRIYREMCLNGEEAARYENRTWEFMLSQMADWEERDRSWSKFRDQVGKTKLLGRRLGVRA